MVDPAFWRGRRVLVTGHTGFKGAWLALWLHRLGAEVSGFAAAPPTAPSLFELARVGDGIEDVRGDVRDPAAVHEAFARARPEVVFHLAAQAIVSHGLADPAGTFATNVMGTVHVLEAARSCVTVVVTSDKCYAPADAPLRETDPLGGRDPYSASKSAQELVAAAYGVATARAGNVIGGGDWAHNRLVPDLMRAALAGEPAVVRQPDAVRPWQHVLDPLAGYLLLAQRLWDGDGRGAWNFGPADAQTVAWLVERVRERWDVDVRVERSDAAGTLRLDSSKARSELGWAPAFDLAAGLDATIAWYRGYAAGEDPRALTVGQIDSFAARRQA